LSRTFFTDSGAAYCKIGVADMPGERPEHD
jgi:hypothetical protein